MLVTGLATAGLERTPTFSSDELTTYFAGALSNDTTQQIYEARRNSVTETFGTPQQLTQVSSTNQEFAPTLSSDGLTLIFASDRMGSYRLWTANRSSTLASFGAPSLLAGFDDPDTSVSYSTPSLSGDGAELWYGRNGVFTHAPTTSSGFGTGTSAPEIGDGGFPSISADRKLLYFASSRTGSQGGLDIWMAQRNDVTAAFDPPTIVAELNSTGHETPSWLSPDNCRLYLESDRGGTFDVYVASRAPAP